MFQLLSAPNVLTFMVVLTRKDGKKGEFVELSISNAHSLVICHSKACRGFLMAVTSPIKAAIRRLLGSERLTFPLNSDAPPMGGVLCCF